MYVYILPTPCFKCVIKDSTRICFWLYIELFLSQIYYELCLCLTSFIPYGLIHSDFIFSFFHYAMGDSQYSFSLTTFRYIYILCSLLFFILYMLMYFFVISLLFLILCLFKIMFVLFFVNSPFSFLFPQLRFVHCCIFCGDTVHLESLFRLSMR